jgi:hypothetical protein
MAGTNNTPFTVDADLVAQASGTGRPSPGYNGSAAIGSGVTPVYAASIELAPFLQKSRFIIINTTALGAATITNAFAPPAPGCGDLVVQINNDAGAARTITFGTGFRAVSTVVGTASKAYLVSFYWDGLTWNETGRAGPV